MAFSPCRRPQAIMQQKPEEEFALRWALAFQSSLAPRREAMSVKKAR
jgi:hypothetical protein